MKFQCKMLYYNPSPIARVVYGSSNRHSCCTIVEQTEGKSVYDICVCI